jgi:hypothetical protein
MLIRAIRDAVYTLTRPSSFTAGFLPVFSILVARPHAEI